MDSGLGLPSQTQTRSAHGFGYCMVFIFFKYPILISKELRSMVLMFVHYCILFNYLQFVTFENVLILEVGFWARKT